MQENKIYTAIGMMSGTSMDGLDAVIIKTDGEDIVEVGDSFMIPYDVAFQQTLKLAIKTRDKEKLQVLDEVLTRMHMIAVENLLAKSGLDREEIDVIGMHGQTVYHAPHDRETQQIGDGDILANATGIAVVSDFRSDDVAAGGQGAPLVPVYHKALSSKLEKPVAFLNIGGVANITWINSKGQMLACDTGPGNALIDDWVSARTDFMYDDGGILATSGKIDLTVLEKLLLHEFFNALPPKSLDRDSFNIDILNKLSLEDGAATLVEFTVEAVAKIVNMLPKKPKEWLICGGGRHNVYMMQRLQKKLEVPVRPVEHIGYNGDTLEAEAFAYMAVRNLRNLPISFPGTTGVTQDMCGGVLSLPNK